MARATAKVIPWTTNLKCSHINLFPLRWYTANTPTKKVVIKAQVLSGGRGRGTFTNGFQGGVHVCSTELEAHQYAEKMLGNFLVTKQNKKGLICNKVLLVEKIETKREMYLSILYDRAGQGIIMVGSPRGGMSIEEVAQTNPELIFKMSIDIATGISMKECEEMAQNLGFPPRSASHRHASELISKLYAMFLARDCKQIEINPLVETPGGSVLCLDAKCNIDDNSQRRQPDLFALRDYTQEDPCEADAEKYDLNYVHLEGGWIGCLVNGAGLAMATMDLIHYKGGEPAVFLDCGGGASEAQVQKAFEIMNMDPYVKVMFVNIFGGIMRCDVIASGIVKAHKHIGVKKPVVVRLRGNKAAEGMKLLAEATVPLVLVDDYEEAAAKAIEIAQNIHEAEREETVA